MSSPESGRGRRGVPRVGIYGGSFDPVHTGHMILAMDAVDELALDWLHLIPAAANPLKQGQRVTDGERRLEMMRLATGGSAKLLVDDREIRRGGVSYAIDTVRELRGDYPEAELFFLIGEDNVTTLDQWKDVGELMGEVTFAAFPRADVDHGAGGVPIMTVGRRIDLSSTEVRARVADGRTVNFLVPEAVRAYISESGLYREGD